MWAITAFLRWLLGANATVEFHSALSEYISTTKNQEPRKHVIKIYRYKRFTNQNLTFAKMLFNRILLTQNLMRETS